MSEPSSPTCTLNHENSYRTFLKDSKVINPRVRVIGLTATPFRPEHTGYARDKFLKWWKDRAALGCPIPSTAREAVALANQGLLAAPERITVRSVAGEKFDRITRWALKDRPVMREPGMIPPRSNRRTAIWACLRITIRTIYRFDNGY